MADESYIPDEYFSGVDEKTPVDPSEPITATEAYLWSRGNAPTIFDPRYTTWKLWSQGLIGEGENLADAKDAGRIAGKANQIQAASRSMIGGNFWTGTVEAAQKFIGDVSQSVKNAVDKIPAVYNDLVTIAQVVGVLGVVYFAYKILKK